MASIIGRLSSPINGKGTRDRIYLETSIKAVVNPTTGETLDKVLTDMKEPMATDKNPGLMSAEDKITVDKLRNQEIFIQSNNPGRECIWIETIENDNE